MMFTRDIPICKGESVQEWHKAANVKSSQVFYFPKQRHIYTLRYTFKTMSVGMAKQRSIAYRAACHDANVPHYIYKSVNGIF